MPGVGGDGHDPVKEIDEKVEQERAVYASDTEFFPDDEKRNHEQQAVDEVQQNTDGDVRDGAQYDGDPAGTAAGDVMGDQKGNQTHSR